MSATQRGIARIDKETGLIEVGNHVPFETVLRRYEGKRVLVTITEIP